MASEMMLTDPLIDPMISFIIIRTLLERIESRAVFAVLFIGVP
jgi:hypothetical protein